MPLLTRPIQVLRVHPVSTWNYHIPDIQTSGPIWCHGQGHMIGDIRVVWLQTAGPTAATAVLGLSGCGGVGNRLIRQSIRYIPGGDAGRPYLV